ncbi:MAG: C-terminal binding protein [Spirochaetales bacterium]|nr:C-terminal binding protein [Spirochaetales bacterium]
MGKRLILVTDDRFGSYAEEEAVLSEVNAEIHVVKNWESCCMPDLLRQAEGVFTNLFNLNSQIIRQLENCKVISRYGVGYDNVDVEAATRKGIWVARVPDYCVEEIATHTLSLLLSCARQLPLYRKSVREGAWGKGEPLPVCDRLQEKVLGIIGFGHAGKGFLKKAMSIGFRKILVNDPYVDEEQIVEAGGIPVPFTELLSEADCLCLHVPLTRDTYHLISENEINRMKNGVIVINTSRGPVIDQAAFVSGLNSGKIGWAGLDVFEKEPLSADDPLMQCPNTVLTPHVGYLSRQSLSELKTKAAQNILRVLKGERPLYPVNSPL